MSSKLTIGVIAILAVAIFTLACNFWRLGTGFQPPYPTPDGASMDFGNAGPPYPTDLASNGARTGDISQFGLGRQATVETDARPDDDVDGVDILANAGTVYTGFTICNRSNIPKDVILNALIDSNLNGQWKNFTGPGGPVNEHFVVNRPVHLEPSKCVIEVAKAQLAYGMVETWIRAMVSDSKVIADPAIGWDGTGYYAVGEVEDYHIKPEINTPTPTPTHTPTLTPTPTITPTPTATRRKMIIDVCAGTKAYDAPNGKWIGVVMQTREGEELGRSDDGAWVNVQIHNDTGWIPVSGLAVNGQCPQTAEEPHHPEAKATQPAPANPGTK